MIHMFVKHHPALKDIGTFPMTFKLDKHLSWDFKIIIIIMQYYAGIV